MSNTAESFQPESDAVLGPDGNPVKENTTAEASLAEPEAQQARTVAAQIPRVSIHIFCEKPETAEAFQKATEDRRLSKAHVTVQMGGIWGGAEHFKELPTPNLIIVETIETGNVIFDQLAELASVCDPSTKVIVIGQQNDITMYRELIRQGVSEYLVTPLSPLTIIESISSLYVDPSAPPIGRNIAFISSRGGAGSSTLAHNFGWLISEKIKDDTVIVDLDLAFGTTGLDFNEDPTQGIGDAITSPERVDEVLLDRLLTKHSDRLSLFTSPGTLDREFDLDPSAFESVLDMVRKTVPYVVLDIPHIWTAWSKSVLFSADDIVVVATPDLASLRNTKNLFELLKAVRPNDAPANLVMNQTGIAKRPEIPTKEFAEAVGTEPVATLPFEPQLFGTASNNGQMLAEVDEKSAIVDDLQRLASNLTGKTNPDEHKKKSILNLLGIKK